MRRSVLVAAVRRRQSRFENTGVAELPTQTVAGVWPQPAVSVALQVAPLNTEIRSGPLLVIVAT